MIHPLGKPGINRIFPCMNPHSIARNIKFPISKWPRNCQYVANLLLQHGLVEGRLCYGFWLGPINPLSPFGGRPFTHHGWVQQEDETIIDPTRWVFECVLPYIYIGPNHGEYDYGGNELKKRFRKPCPAYDPHENQFDFSETPPEAQAFIRSLIPGAVNVLSRNQTFWLANSPLDLLGNQAKPIYKWFVSLHLKAWIPYDNQVLVLGTK